MDRLVGALWPSDVAGNFTIWTHPDRISYHIPLPDVRSITESDLDELRQENATNCIYFGLGLRRDGLSPKVRGGKKDIVALPGFVIDIDVATASPDVHKATNLPQTDEHVFAILEPFAIPSMVVHTGHGYHVYWLFDEPLQLHTAAQQKRAGEAFERFQVPIIQHAASMGFHVDKTDTIDRVWRIPGFNNVKSAPIVPVVLAEQGDARYPLSDFGLADSPSPRHSGTQQPGNAKKTVDGSIAGSRHPSQDSSKTRQPREAISTIKLRKILKNLSDPDHVRIFDAVLKGESFADPGERDAAMQQACSVLVYAAKGKGEPEALAEILKPSLKVWADEPESSKTLDEEVGKAIDKITRAQRDWDENEAADERRRQKTLDALGRKFFGDKSDKKLVEQHLIIQFRRSYFVFDFSIEHYIGPHIREELLTVVRDAFAGTNFPVTYVNASGDIKQMQPPTLMEKYGTVAGRMQGSLALQHSYYAPKDKTFHFATTPMRSLEPRFDPDIDDWLGMFGGGDSSIVLDWVAGVSQLTRQCAALALIGPPGTGKSTLGLGLARLWHEAGPTRWELSVGANFNESMTQCPLIELSEGIDTPKGTSSAFRALTGTQELVINPKGLSPYSVIGCVRIMITSNDDTVLNDITGTRELSNASVHAVAERLIYINVNPKAKNFLDSLKKRDPRTIDRWINESLIARHALWLRDNRALSPTSRFLVRGHVTPIHQRLVAKKKDSESLLEWITGYMSNPTLFEKNFRTKKRVPYTSIGDDMLLLNGPEIQETWELYANDTAEKLSVTKIGSLLANLRIGTRKLNRNGVRVRAHEIDTGVVFTFAQANMLGDLDAMQGNFTRRVTPDNVIPIERAKEDGTE
jgi:hypothetical protein